ncbi:hypothetical protein [Mucilaginibacter jinjuensis]|uniref:Lipocalin-like protein n=1 Tax=Mucilaginibacter jinjuensis TaxID=1176721 RepID=A0ABY7TC30_9SPHI|nr:hypothetical protein [Mucilaginibacter jinjuensis]WCT13996.1 hypothetical protein PQO05_08620 [Mucilaginibacter jinjuensis]
MKNNDTTPTPVPTGTFSGEFRVVHLNPLTQKLDTTKRSNLTLTISQSTGYKVTGDTVLYHAGSYGDFALNGTYIQFIDKTVPANATGTLPKIHLAGTYQYIYDGTNFQFQAASDTLAYQYILKKSN